MTLTALAMLKATCLKKSSALGGILALLDEKEETRV